MSEMGIALELLGVGMVTVFIILSLVVIIGGLIIKFVNAFMPQLEKDKAIAPVSISSQDINPKKMAAIVSAVNVITNGTGRVKRVEKL